MTDYRLDLREGYFQTLPGKDLFELICGAHIATGTHRSVFEYKPDPSCVIKYEYASGLANAKEWILWQDLFEHENRKWLAPCVLLSECGMWLVQKKTRPVRKGFKWPHRVPLFLTDMKHENFGIYKGRLVCHDYESNLCCNYARSKAMKKSDSDWITPVPQNP